MNKKILSLVLALVMVLGTFTSVFAAAETKTDDKKAAEAPKAGEKVEKVVGKDNKIQYIIDKKFVEGYEDGSMGYDKHIKRSEITRLLVLANGYEDLAKQLQGSMKIYSDVDAKHWANGVITVGTTRPSDANGIAMLAGYPDGTFKPENDVTYAELAKMLVVLVKKDLTADMVKNAVWASSWMTWAAELGILDDVTVADSNAPATRADAFTMMYNALYKMQAFKRVPANEKIGVLSSLSNSKLVLNQDKDQEYTITTDTVFVHSYKDNLSNVVKVKDITNPNYYLGSLVRIMVNDKKEVTHILELGNPKNMALGRPEGTAGTNDRWAGVADKTVSTGFTNINTLKNTGTYDSTYNGFVAVKFNANDTKVKTLEFVNRTAGNTVSLRVNDKTKVYVANPYNNIMREVKDINEALSLIGFKNYKDGYQIPNVYAGYNTTDVKPVYGAIQTDGLQGTATHVVFNVVSKDDAGSLYRVVNSSSSLGNATLEDTDGKLVDRDFFKNLTAFPYNYGDLYDVIRVRAYGYTGSDVVATVIDHSNTKEFPIVKVVGFDKNSIRVEDQFGDRSFLDVRDADIFNAKQWKNIQVGDTLQFRVENHGKANATNVAEVISLLPANTKLAGTLQGVIASAQKEQAVGTIVNVTGMNDLYAKVVIDVYRDLFDGDLRQGRHEFIVDKDVAAVLENNIGREVAFKVQKDYGYAGNYKAYDFVDNKTQLPLVGATTPSAAQKALDDAKKAVAEYEAISKDVNATAAAKEAAKTKAKDAVAKVETRDDQAALNDRITAAEKIEAASNALADKITEAQNKMAGVVVSADGKDVATDKKWVTEKMDTDLRTAIAEAKAVKSDKEQAYKDAQTKLETATTNYNPQPGTKANA